MTGSRRPIIACTHCGCRFRPSQIRGSGLSPLAGAAERPSGLPAAEPCVHRTGSTALEACMAGATMLDVAIGTHRLLVRRQCCRSGQFAAHATRSRRPVVLAIASAAHGPVVWNERLSMSHSVAVSAAVLRLHRFPVTLDAHRPYTRFDGRSATSLATSRALSPRGVRFPVASTAHRAVAGYDCHRVRDAAAVCTGAGRTVLLLVAPTAHGAMARNHRGTVGSPTAVGARAPRTVSLDVAALTDPATIAQHELRCPNPMALGAWASRSVVTVIAVWAYPAQPIDHGHGDPHLPATCAWILGLDVLAVAGGANRTGARQKRVGLGEPAAQAAWIPGLVLFVIAAFADGLPAPEAQHHWLGLPTIVAAFDRAVVAAISYDDTIRPYKLYERGFTADTTGSAFPPGCRAGACGAFGHVANNLVPVIADWPQDSHTILVTLGAFMLLMPLSRSGTLSRQVLADAFCIPANRALTML